MESKRPVKHEIVTGYVANGRIERPFWAGEAFHFEEEDYYQLNLSVFPFSYYLSRNKDSADSFTIWAQKLKDVGPVLFRRPIGKAIFSPEVEGYLELCIPLLNFKFAPYLNLAPNN